MLLRTKHVQVASPVRGEKSYFKAIQGNKSYIPGYSTQFRYWRDLSMRRNGPKRKGYSLKFPEKYFDDLGLKRLISERRLHWTPYFRYAFDLSTKTYFPYIPDIICIVMDIDRPVDEVVELVDWREKWGFAKKFPVSIVRSNGGNTHIHVLVDVSELSYLPNFGCDPRHYELTERYKGIKRLKSALYETFFRDTGVEPDWQALNSDHICPAPDEIANFNKFWSKRSPIKYSDINRGFFEGATAEKIKRSIGQVSELSAELFKMLDDPQLVEELIKYSDEAGNGRPSRRLLTIAVKWLRRERESIISHWVNNPSIIWYLKRKTEDISVKKKTVNQEVFGLEGGNLTTYTRIIALYIFGFKLQTPYIKKIKSNLYERASIEKKYFNSDFLNLYWYKENINANVSKEAQVPEADRIAAVLGSGRTYTEVKRHLPYLVARYGRPMAEAIMIKAIRSSSANDKKYRESWIRSFSRAIERSLTLQKTVKESTNVYVERQIGNRNSSLKHEPGSLSGGGFFDNQPPSRGEGGGGGLFTAVQYPN